MVTPLRFVREQCKDDRRPGVPYRFLGAARRVDDAGERPISITFELLDGDIPADLLMVPMFAAG